MTRELFAAALLDPAAARAALSTPGVAEWAWREQAWQFFECFCRLADPSRSELTHKETGFLTSFIWDVAIQDLRDPLGLAPVHVRMAVHLMSTSVFLAKTLAVPVYDAIGALKDAYPDVGDNYYKALFLYRSRPASAPEAHAALEVFLAQPTHAEHSFVSMFELSHLVGAGLALPEFTPVPHALGSALIKYLFGAVEAAHAARYIGDYGGVALKALELLDKLAVLGVAAEATWSAMDHGLASCNKDVARAAASMFIARCPGRVQGGEALALRSMVCAQKVDLEVVRRILAGVAADPEFLYTFMPATIPAEWVRPPSQPGTFKMLVRALERLIAQAHASAMPRALPLSTYTSMRAKTPALKPSYAVWAPPEVPAAVRNAHVPRAVSLERHKARMRTKRTLEGATGPTPPPKRQRMDEQISDVVASDNSEFWAAAIEAAT